MVFICVDVCEGKVMWVWVGLTLKIFGRITLMLFLLLMLCDMFFFLVKVLAVHSFLFFFAPTIIIKQNANKSLFSFLFHNKVAFNKMHSMLQKRATHQYRQ